VKVPFAPEAAGREYFLANTRLLNQYRLYARGRATRRAGRRRPSHACTSYRQSKRPWNKGLLIGQEKPLEPKHVWSIRVRLEIARSRCDLAIFNLAIDSKLRACDLVKLRLDDICSGANVRHRATIVQKKTGRPVQFEITEQSRSSVEAWLPMLRATGSRYLFRSRLHASFHISTRQYARLVHRWVESIGLESAPYGTHSMRRTKAAQIIARQATCAPCGSSSAILNWRAPSDILGLR
jgi:integrase